MFNMTGSEIIVILLLALVILGPEKLPEAVRKFGRTYAEFKKVSTGFQSEFKAALEEPMREMRDTADLLAKSVDFRADGAVDHPMRTAATDLAERASEASEATAAPTVQPTEDIPFGEPADGEPADGEPADGEPADGEPTDGEPTDARAADGEPAETLSVDPTDDARDDADRP